LRNVVFIVVDTLRADRLGCYGHDRPVSPGLDELAARSTVHDALWSASNFTAPAFSTIFTGLSPSRHGVFDFGARLGSSAIHAAMGAAGMRSAGIVTFRFFKRLLGDVWGEIEAVTDGRSFNYDPDLPRAVSDGAVEWLEAHGGDGPFCLFLHYDAPHMPYRLPAEYESMFDTVPESAVDRDARAMLFPREQAQIHGQKGGHVLEMFDWIEGVNRGRRRLKPETIAWMKDRYDASIRYNDDQIVRVLEALRTNGLEENTVVGVFSDHGEEFLDHGFLAHGGIHMYEELIRTVGIIHDPGAEPKRVASPRGHAGILPTLMARAGVPLPPSLAGLDFDAQDGSRPVFCEGEFKVAMRQGSRKWIKPLPTTHISRMKRFRHWLKMAVLREVKFEQFDLAADPGETRNVATRAGHVEFDEAWNAHRHAAPLADEVPVKTGSTDDLDDKEREDLERFLRDMGYMK
jgi:arylsulfatase A-like enzyme